MILCNLPDRKGNDVILMDTTIQFDYGIEYNWSERVSSKLQDALINLDIEKNTY